MTNLDSERYGADCDTKIDELRSKIKGLDRLKVRDDVFDEHTLMGLYKLVTKGWISALGGPISTGKESTVFLAEREGRPIAIKIYLTRTANFHKMLDYIAGDRRFINIGKSRRDVIFAWTRKEFSNLKRAYEVGLPVPEPFVFERNILVLEFLGEGEQPYPQIRIADVSDYQKAYDRILEFVQILWSEARLIHGDLSEYNILYGDDKPYLIDMGQAVTPDHPHAPVFLRRDIDQINRFFSERCIIKETDTVLADLYAILEKRSQDKDDYNLLERLKRR